MSTKRIRKSDHAAIFLRSKYVSKPVTHEVRKWSGQSEAALQSALHDAVWSTFQDTTINTESVVDLICETTEATVLKTTVHSTTRNHSLPEPSRMP